MKKQVTLSVDQGFSGNFESCRQFVQYRVLDHKKPQKAIAADMDLSPSQLSRKLSQSAGDSARFTLDDAEKYMEENDDVEPIYYLIDKFIIRKTNSEERVLELEEELARLKSQGNNT